MELDDYDINSETLIIEPIDKKTSKVVELHSSFIVHKSCLSILKESCLFFGSSYEGRVDSTRNFLDCKAKVPIIIEESRNIIFFPTSSIKNDDCVWISYQNLLKYSRNNDYSTVLYFHNNISIIVNVRYNVIDNQIIRCIKLETMWNKRKSDF